MRSSVPSVTQLSTSTQPEDADVTRLGGLEIWKGAEV